MTLEEVDNEIQLWKASLSAAAQNLMDLHSLPTYQRLAGTNGVPQAQLSGLTAARVYPALASMGILFQNFDDLQSTIEQAAQLRGQISPIFGSEQKLREIEGLLRGKSVKLPAPHVPIEQRNLATVGDTVVYVTPAELMGAMARSFTAARDVVIAVDAAWEKLGLALDRAVTEVAEFRAEGHVWVAALPDFTKVEESLAAIQSRVVSDPLACNDEFEASVTPVLNEARAALARFRTKRDQIKSGLTKAALTMSQMADLHQQSIEAAEERQLKTTSVKPAAEPPSEETVIALREWLHRLDDKFNEGMLDPIAVGLSKWEKAAAACIEQERASLEANIAPVKARNELRGRLEALKAKARARGCAEHPELTRLASEATQLLFSRPTPVEQSASLVIDYERVLRTQTQGHAEDPGQVDSKAKDTK